MISVEAVRLAETLSRLDTLAVVPHPFPDDHFLPGKHAGEKDLAARGAPLIQPGKLDGLSPHPQILESRRGLLDRPRTPPAGESAQVLLQDLLEEPVSRGSSPFLSTAALLLPDAPEGLSQLAEQVVVRRLKPLDTLEDFRNRRDTLLDGCKFHQHPLDLSRKIVLTPDHFTLRHL